LPIRQPSTAALVQALPERIPVWLPQNPLIHPQPLKLSEFVPPPPTQLRTGVSASTQPPPPAGEPVMGGVSAVVLYAEMQRLDVVCTGA
jgi:hypothetical protein